MKILYISPKYSGGIGGHAFRVAEKLREQGYDVKLMHVPHLPIKNLKNPSFAIFGIIIAIFDREKYDVVHAWNIPSSSLSKITSYVLDIVDVECCIHSVSSLIYKNSGTTRYPNEALL